MKSKRKNVREVKKMPEKASPAAVLDLPALTPKLSPNGKPGTPKPDRSQTVRILVVDDHPLFRHGLIQLLSSDAAFSVCGQSGTAPEALSMIRKLSPNLVIADVGLTGPSGLELTKSIRAEFPR